MPSSSTPRTPREPSPRAAAENGTNEDQGSSPDQSPATSEATTTEEAPAPQSEQEKENDPVHVPISDPVEEDADVPAAGSAGHAGEEEGEDGRVRTADHEAAGTEEGGPGQQDFRGSNHTRSEAQVPNTFMFNGSLYSGVGEEEEYGEDYDEEEEEDGAWGEGDPDLDFSHVRWGGHSKTKENVLLDISITFLFFE